ncbi:2853_t:CDS:2 [Funneliformis caledonium]|uniref:2853_t:CDS:1 n=1 Tax=Funneliformis caledonium TaxID=1117310 RepID=A0A9N8V6Z6_9GLOM|nr:2853_t:CDS:2 [Funneliformis caledonium]
MPIEENLMKEFQNGEKVLIEIAEIIGNIAERDYNSSAEINPSIASKIVAQTINNNNNSRLPKARLER